MRNAVEMVRSIALFGVVVFAINVLADETTINGQTWSYSIQDGKARIERRIDSRTGECGYSGDLIVPTKINGKPVVEVDRYAFSRGTAISSVVIPSGVLLEDKFRFEGCTALKSVKISEPMSEITSAMFENCSALVSVEMPAAVTRIGAWAFYGCTSLKSLNALSVVVEVGEKAFYGCVNLAVTIDLSVLQKIGAEAFYDCGKMLFTGSPTLVTRIPDYAFYGCGSLGDMNVAPCITEIGAYAFGGCSNLILITGIGDNVLQIGEGAFSGCSKITSMYIPSNLKNIPSSLFRGCKSLERVVMGNGVTNIEEQAFSGCVSLGDMKLSSTLVSIGEWAFSGCPIAFPLPASVRKIDWHIFSAPVDELVLDGCVTKDMEWPFTRREVGTYYDQDPYNGHYYRDYSKDVASGALKIFEWNDTGENFHLTLEDSWSLYYTDVSITPFRTGREYHEWSPPIVYRRDAEISIVPAARSVIQGRTAISLLAPHEDVELFYTIDGSDPRTNGIKYEQKFSIRGKTTVRAVGYYKGNLTTKELVAKYGTGEVSTPVITSSQPEFNFSGNQIAIACATSGVQIHYTTDGSEPTADSPLYSAPFCIDETTMIKAIAVGHAEYMDSLIAVREFKREWLTVPSPVVSPGDGGSFDTVKGVVTITCPLSGATIYYTTDGTKPTRQSPVYSGPFEIDSDTVVRAFAGKADYLDSASVKATIYNRQPFAATPIISLAGGGTSFVGSKGVVSIACVTDGAVLHYTLDGSTPTAESPIYMEPFGITETTTVTAFASKLGCRDSEVVTATFEKQWAYGDSLGCPDMTFVSEGGDWVADPDVSCDGTGSLRSPMVVQDGKSYALYTVVDGPQQVSFFWLASCEKDEWDEFFYDHAEFWVDDVLVAQIDGQDKTWSYVEAKVQGLGSHTLKWVYVKDASGKTGMDCVWVDSIRLGQSAGAYVITFNPMGGICAENTRTVRRGDALGKMPIPLNGSNGFVGWFTHPVYGAEITEAEAPSSDEVLYAHWSVSADRQNQQETIDGYTWFYDVFKDGYSYVKGVRFSSKLSGDIHIPDFLGGCPVVRIELPDNITTDSFFGRSDIRSLRMPKYLCRVGDEALVAMYGLVSIEVGSFCESIGRGVLDSNEDLEEFIVSTDNMCYSSHSGVLFDKECETLIKCPQGRTTCVIPSGVKILGVNSFSWCNKITSIVMPDTVLEIENYAFSNCVSLECIKFSPEIHVIGEGAFYGCSELRVVNLPEGLREVSGYAFYRSGLTQINIPSSVEHIGQFAFKGCQKLGAGVVVVDNCLLCVNEDYQTDVVVPAGTRLIVGGAFNGLCIKSVVIPGTVKCIGYGAFEGCETLESITISEGVESIEPFSFRRCVSVQSVNIPRSVSYMGICAFEDCTLNFDGKPPVADGRIFNGDNGMIRVCPNQGWDRIVKRGSWWGAIVEYRTEELSRFDKITVAPLSSGNEDLYIEKTWHEGYSEFESMYGTKFPDAYLKPTGKLDSSGSPMCVWQDYVAGTDPTDVSSVFKAKITMVDGKPKVEWEPNLNENGVVREYKVFGKENLTDTEWQSPISDQCKFFKVEVSMPK